jgi:uncharacterized protein (DUF924 family)
MGNRITSPTAMAAAPAMIAYGSAPWAGHFAGPSDVLTFWFGSREALGQEDHLKHRMSCWFGDAPPEFAQAQRDAGQAIAEAAVNLHGWHGPGGILARILLLDQFPRSAFRGTAKAFQYDSVAVELTKIAIAEGYMHVYNSSERSFCYLPLMHSEDIAHQELCIAQIMKDKENQSQLAFTHSHADTIRRFARFPHRNKLLVSIGGCLFLVHILIFTQGLSYPDSPLGTKGP